GGADQLEPPRRRAALAGHGCDRRLPAIPGVGLGGPALRGSRDAAGR
ncbi:MAG: FIG01121307: hypothetical protein, partial [uncultured Nocardioidaceae bacterium]